LGNMTITRVKAGLGCVPNPLSSPSFPQQTLKAKPI